MLQKIFFFVIFAIVFQACKDDTATNSAKPKEGSAVVQTESGRKVVLPSKPVDETDILGRMEFGMRTLQEEFDRSSADMPTIGNVKVSIDEEANLTIKNEVDGVVRMTKVNLKDLETAQGGFQLMPDEQEGEYPGLLIHTKQNARKVAYYVDGKLRQRSGELQLYLVDRAAIERITPAMLQTVIIAQEKQ